MMISDNKAIREALVTKSTDFAGRPVFNFDSILNPRMKGTVMMLPALCAWKRHCMGIHSNEEHTLDKVFICLFNGSFIATIFLYPKLIQLTHIFS